MASCLLFFDKVEGARDSRMDSCIVSCFLNGALEFCDYFLQHAFVHYSQITLHFLN